MKDTFFHLPEEKRKKIIESCIEEFGSQGYESGSTDRIIQKSGISKGGLYEYIHSKKELFLFIVDYTYQLLYDYIQNKIEDRTLPADILERFDLVSSIAIDFYLSRTDVIMLISKTNRIEDPLIRAEVEKTFLKRFLPVFGDVGTENLAFDREKILELLEWLLLKTRNDFLDEIEKKHSVNEVKTRYMENWKFILSVLRDGIYKKGRQ